MWRLLVSRSWGLAIVGVFLLLGVGLGLSLASPGRPGLSTAARGSLLLAGIAGIGNALSFAGLWMLALRRRGDVIRDRSWDPRPVPPPLIETQAELALLGFVAVGQAELMLADGRPGRVYEYFASSSDPTIAASLSFQRVGGSFASYLEDGRSLETVYPPTGLGRRRAVSLPNWLQVTQCSEGVTAAFLLHRDWLEREAAAGAVPIRIPDYTWVLAAENAGITRIRTFNEQQIVRNSKSSLGPLLLALLALWIAAFWT